MIPVVKPAPARRAPVKKRVKKEEVVMQVDLSALPAIPT